MTRSESALRAAQDESTYRLRVQDLFAQIERALRDIDPDVIETELTSGVLSLHLADRSRCILSAQPALRQVWLALTGVGQAFHFVYELTTQTWRDEKDASRELIACLEAYLTTRNGLKTPLN